ncbi:MAG TPA: isoprenylcysteine carboxylmethyltransferase family protein [bacterium]|jgi:protein-S-isoprenylcysteine O-methyltransferase Ste14
MNALTPFRLLYLCFNAIFFPGLILGLGGDLHWTEGWIFTAWFVCTVFGSAFYLNRRDPALLAERFKRPGSGGQKGWDKVFMALLMSMVVFWFIVMPLDARRFHWTASFPLAWKVTGLLLLLCAVYIIMRTMFDNSFASPLVRIQRERDHHIITTGIYGVVRHPMYLGGLMYFFGAPLLLGSKYGLLIGLLLSLMFVARIFGEEKTLLTQFPDYADYRQKVRHRLIPFVW